jgi:SAM-dependent methyltransferase
MTAGADPAYVCPRCRSPLRRDETGLECPSCGRSYPVSDGVADFVSGEYYDRFPAGAEPSEGDRAGLEHEVAGAIPRIRDFYLPKIERARRRSGRTGHAWRVLDCGCGNGISVDVLNEAGVAAWGNDPSAMRQWQWRERTWRERLSVADGSSLPFPDGFFDAVLASGVLEHVGVEESRSAGYAVRPLPSRDADRRRFLAELLRVTATDGTIWLDFPNGAFPIDFWHGDRPGAARRHGRVEGFLPTAAEVRGLFRDLAPTAAVRFHSPHRRLKFRQVGRHWYGAVLSLPARLFLRAMAVPPLTFLASSPANPFLVVEVRRRDLSGSRGPRPPVEPPGDRAPAGPRTP